MSSKLQLKREDPDGASGKCPSCGAAMAEDAVICLSCGFDTRTGRRADDEAPPRQNPLLVAALAVVIVGATAVVLVRAMKKEDTAATPASATAPVASPPLPQATTDAPSNLSPVAAESTAATTVPSPQAAVASPADTAPAAPADAAADWDAVAQKQRDLAAAQLDRVAPMFEAGGAVELRMTNGIVQRGVLRALTDEHLVLEVSSNDVRQIALPALDRSTRVRADLDYRDRYIDFHAQQRVRELMKSAESKQE